MSGREAVIHGLLWLALMFGSAWFLYRISLLF